MTINLKSPLAALTLLAMIALPQVAKSTVLDFEDLSGFSYSMPSNYGGLTWSNWGYYGSYQPPYNPSSGVQRLWMPNEATSSIQFGADVTLNSFWLAGYELGQTVQGYNNGSLVNSYAVANTWGAFGMTLSLNWSGIDELRIVDGDNFGNRYLVLDDLKFTGGGSQDVPDTGATLALVGSALLGFAALRRRFVR